MRKILPRDYKWRQNDDDIIVTNRGDTSERTINLPPAVEGMRREYIVYDAVGIKLQAYGTDTIRIGSVVCVAGGYVRCSAVGGSVKLVGMGSGEWFASSRLESWTADS